MLDVVRRSLSVQRAPVGWWRNASRLSAVFATLFACLIAWFGLFSAPSAQAWDADRILSQATRLGGHTLQLTQALLEVIQKSSRLDEDQRLLLINQFFNQHILFREDIETWNQLDYWASPLEMLWKGQGDCEDYAIGKFFSLLASGVPGNRLRMVYVKAVLGGQGGVQQAHMVLAYYATPAADPLILDNLVGDIRPASRRPDLTPVFSFNAEGLWQGTQGPGVGDPSARLSRWRDVLAKARQEGFFQ